MVKTIEAASNKASADSENFSIKLGELETLLTGMHSQSMILTQLRRSDQIQRDARAAAEDTKLLFAIAEKHKNDRIKSYLAAQISLISMSAKAWNDAVEYAKLAIECNPKKWDDRMYNFACIYAAKFDDLHQASDKAQAISFLDQYFSELDGQKLVEELGKAMLDEDLLPVKAEMRALAQKFGKAREVACRLALKYKSEQRDIDKQDAIELLKQYFERNGEKKVDATEIQAVVDKPEFQPIHADIVNLAKLYKEIKNDDKTG